MSGLEYLAGRALERCADLFAGDEGPLPLLEVFRLLPPDRRQDLEQGEAAQRFALLAQDYCAGPGSPAAELALGLAVACALDPLADAALRRAVGGPLTFALAWQMAFDRSPWEDVAEAQQTLEQVRWFLPVRQGREDLQAPLAADERLLTYLAGSDRVDPLLEDVAQFAPPSEQQPLIRPELLERTRSALARVRRSGDLLHLWGTAGVGKQYALSLAARAEEVPLLVADCRLLSANPVETVWSMMDSILRETLFYGAVVCLRRADSFARRPQPGSDALPWEARLLHLCVAPLLRQGVTVCLCTDGPASFLPWADRPVQRIEFPDCTRAEQIALWRGMARREGLELDAVQCGSKYKLTPRQIAVAAEQLARETDSPTPGDVARVCGRVLPPPDQGGIRRIRTRYTLDDLKLPEVQKQKLQNIADHVIYRHRVYDEWNMESRFAYGRNVSALFVGPPGTGKTMAVHVLSNMLDLPLYRIDLSQVVDKYIGETEKRLEKIFDTAEKSNVILFFDEADSIFGKRSEVNDAKDKYANTEVSYILQRIEQYDGIVILATNYKRNIDEAFMRRMRYLVEFQMPSPELRKEIWQSCFTPQVPLQEIDFPYLARQFELSGGSIKNVALNAVFLAADSGGPVTMRHILESLRDENLKMGKPMLPQDFAEYALLMQ